MRPRGNYFLLSFIHAHHEFSNNSNQVENVFPHTDITFILTKLQLHILHSNKKIRKLLTITSKLQKKLCLVQYRDLKEIKSEAYSYHHGHQQLTSEVIKLQKKMKSCKLHIIAIHSIKSSFR